MAKSLFEYIVNRDLTVLTKEDLSKVKYIGGYAFSSCNQLTNVEIPKGVKSIDERGFFQCISLESVFFESGVESLGILCFSGCSKLKDLQLPDTLKEIKQGCFGSNTSLTSVTIPNNVNIIGPSAFANSSGAMNITNAYFRQPSGMAVTLPTAGSSKGMFYVKTARNMNVYTDNETIKNYDWATDNITATFYHLDGTAW